MENGNKSESIVIIVFTLVIVVIIGILAYSAFSSTNNLESNSSNFESTPNTTNNSSTPNNNPQPQNGSEGQTVTETVTPKPPVETQIAEFSSNIYDKDENRVHNISLAISKINGAIIKNDETFSFNQTVGPMGLEQGFKEAIGFDTNGEKIKMPGGGMCQISSTIYNAALIANLEIVERHPHS
jgi:vancomycin resistance protein YoaR